ncbi:MAG: hypothetical protein AAF434_03035 [Pseudomonadota bacterium]
MATQRSYSDEFMLTEKTDITGHIFSQPLNFFEDGDSKPVGQLTIVYDDLLLILQQIMRMKSMRR